MERDDPDALEECEQATRYTMGNVCNDIKERERAGKADGGLLGLRGLRWTNRDESHPISGPRHADTLIGSRAWQQSGCSARCLYIFSCFFAKRERPPLLSPAQRAAARKPSVCASPEPEPADIPHTTDDGVRPNTCSMARSTMPGVAASGPTPRKRGSHSNRVADLDSRFAEAAATCEAV